MKGSEKVKKRQLFEEYITKNIDSAYRFAYTYVKNTADAEDIVNESVAKAISSLNSLRNTKYIKTWFYKIISNSAINFLHYKKRYVYIEDSISKMSCEDDYSDISFNSIINILDIKYREIIVLRFLEDMPIKEIADILGINENTVKTRLYRGLKILKVDMEGEI